MAELVITIDGPAASGKSTIARLLAEKLGASFLDTGAMYRAVTLAAMQADVDMKNQQKLLEVLDTRDFKFSIKNDKMAVHVDGTDVTEQIRSPAVTENSRYIASAEEIRSRLVEMQRKFAAGQKKIVTEGRDQGTVAFKDANIKFFLSATLDERAKRRYRELQERRQNTGDRRQKNKRKHEILNSKSSTGHLTAETISNAQNSNNQIQGTDYGLEEIKKAIEQRDKSDQDRNVGPLKPADDAIIIDTTDLSIEQVLEKVLFYIRERCSKIN